MPSEQHRNWCFTLKLSGMEDPLLAKLKDVAWQNKMLETRNLKFMIGGVEHGGESGYLHVQGVICYKTNQTFAAVKKDLASHVHLEPTRVLAEAIAYCRKEDKTPILVGNEPHLAPGKRSDLIAFKDAAFARMPVREMYDAHTRPMIMYPKAYEKMRSLADKEAAKVTGFKDTKVLWVVGRTGTGKSAGARFQFPDIFNVMLPEPHQRLWFDGYQGQNEILLDDFAGEIGYRLLLRITDIYPMQLEIKGGFLERAWHVVIITSNKTPAECYPAEAKEDNVEPLLRRVKIIQLPADQDQWPLPDEVREAMKKKEEEDAAGYAALPSVNDGFVF